MSVARALVVLGGVTIAAVALSSAIAIAGAKIAPAPVPSTSLSSTPTLARVSFEVTPGGAAITHDLVFPADSLHVASKTDAASEATIFVAFTAQSRPLAIEATLHSLDASRALVEAGATKLAIDDVNQRPSTAALVLGAEKSSGHSIRVPHVDGAFGVRLRSAIATYPVEGAGEVPLIARLGVRNGAPIVIERIEVVGTRGVTIRGARAWLCGGKGDDTPLTLVFPGYPPSTTDAGTVPPASVTRGEGDDLCVNVLF
ncbi:MAG: hypothetical protein ACHREM_21865 [Polyangiales bacterium]